MWWGGGWTQGEGYPDLSLYKCNSANDFGGYCSQTHDHLIAQVYAPGTPAQAQQHLYAYEMYVAKHLPVLFMPDYIGSGISPAPYQVVKTWLHGWAKWHLPVYRGQNPGAGPRALPSADYGGEDGRLGTAPDSRAAAVAGGGPFWAAASQGYQTSTGVWRRTQKWERRSRGSGPQDVKAG